ncbi:hypothetical protein Sjap_016875 [Stephania japonica]|uniref:Uncharacterized protein n=1 Tax=Stephania japonica TaxID=461633 RepID=A0AAP0I533_9MAGN
MRKMYPNLDREEGLDTVLEVPIPEKIVESICSNKTLQLQNMHQWLKNQSCTKLSPSPSTPTASSAEFHLVLNVLGSPHPRSSRVRSCNQPPRQGWLHSSTAKYITQQYMAATGGQVALNALKCMYVMGMVRMGASEFRFTEEDSGKIKGNGKVGGFVLWQKNPDLWVQVLVVSGCKISAGSDGKLSWR